MKHITATIIVAMLAVLIAVAVIGVVAATTSRVEKDVRITARLLENGKVEFGLQERTDGGEWSETLLPRVNKFPYATAAVDRWLFSSPVALTPVEFETVQEVVETDPEPEESSEPGAEVFSNCDDAEVALQSAELILFDSDREHDVGQNQIRVVLSNDGQQWGLAADEHNIRDGDGDGVVCENLFE